MRSLRFLDLKASGQPEAANYIGSDRLLLLLLLALAEDPSLEPGDLRDLSGRGNDREL